MRGIWAVARYTFSQCLRMKVAVLFILILAMSLAVMALGDDPHKTLADRVRVFLSYSTSLTGFLLSVVTVVLAVSVVSSDVQGKQIFTVVTKPLPRWQYIVGRWLGVVMLGGILLAGSGAAIFTVAQNMRGGEALNPNDRRAVETEIFTARNKVSPDPIDAKLDALVAQQIARLKEQNRYDEAIQGFVARNGGDIERAKRDQAEQLRRDLAEKLQSAGPGGGLSWEFSGVKVAGGDITGSGEVMEVDPNGFAIAVRAPPKLIGHLVYTGPVIINGVDGQVIAVAPDAFAVSFTREDMGKPRLSNLEPGKKVDITISPNIQITYKATAAQEPSDGTVRSAWAIFNLTRGLAYQRSRSDSANLPATLTVSARLVDKESLTVEYLNMNVPNEQTDFSTSVTILNKDISLLYRVGSFEWNFVRGNLLILVQLMFLAALGVMAGSFLSFPVGLLLCMVLMLFSFFTGFLLEAVTLGATPTGGVDPLAVIGHYAMKGITFLLPDFESTSPAESLVGGLNIAWGTLTAVWARTGLIRTAMLLLVACLIFHKRELARVQV